MPSIDEFADRSETRQKTLHLTNPGGKKFDLWVEFYLNRLTAEPIKVSDDDVDPDEGAQAANTMRGATSFCDVMKAWDLTGPVVSRSGETIVQSGDEVPIEPLIIRCLPSWFTDAVTNALVDDVFPNRNGSRPSRRR